MAAQCGSHRQTAAAADSRLVYFLKVPHPTFFKLMEADNLLHNSGVETIPQNTMTPLRYAITERSQYGSTEPERRAGLSAQAERLAVDGVEFIQLREKDLAAGELIGVAREILSAIRCSRSGTRLLINARADIALACGADGVHLPSGLDQLKPRQIRHLFRRHAPNDGQSRFSPLARHSDREQSEGQELPYSGRSGNISPIISVSCHTPDDVERARDAEADLILFGPVYGKFIDGKEVVSGKGLEALQAACERAGAVPVVALGGVTAANLATTIEAGAEGFAGIRFFR